MSEPEDTDILINLITYLITQRGGIVSIPVQVIDEWLNNEPRYEFWRNDDIDGLVTFKVREIPVGLPGELMGEAAGLLEVALASGDGNDEIERAIWLLSRGRRGDPHHEEFDT